MGNHSEFGLEKSIGGITAWHVASYPRSGNHLVRAILEAYTKRPTEGCLGAHRDMPIHKRSANKSGIIQIEVNEPIAFKAHALREIHARERMFGSKALGMILITRDPAQAIASHAARFLSNKRKFPFLTKRRKRLVIGSEIDKYLALVHRFSAHQPSARLHVKFEDLVHTGTASNAAASLLECIGGDLEGPDLKSVAALAKDSQVSLGERAVDLKREISAEVEQMLSYQEVLDYLEC